MTLNFSFLGENYDEQDDTEYASGAFPAFYFVDGEIHGIVFLAENRHPSSNSEGFIGIQGDPQKLYYGFNEDQEYEGNISWPANPYPVPEPSALALCSVGSLCFFRRKRPAAA